MVRLLAGNAHWMLCRAQQCGPRASNTLQTAGFAALELQTCSMHPDALNLQHARAQLLLLLMPLPCSFWHHSAELVQLVDAGADVNEVEAAGNTPLHSAAFEGWLEGAQLLLQLGAKINASNNAGDRPWVGCASGIFFFLLLKAAVTEWSPGSTPVVY